MSVLSIRTTHVSARGQVTIPKPIRDHLGLTKGGPVEFVVTDAGAVLVRPRFESAQPLKGLLQHYAGNIPISLDAIDKGIGCEVANQLAKRSDNEK